MRIVFFDGYCSLCNGFIDWLILRDKRQTLQFSSLQGETARQLLPEADRPANSDWDSIIYLRDGVVLKQSSAVLAAVSDISGPWRIVQIFRFIPQGLRDFVYKVIARNRYKLFARRESCRRPTPSERGRLLP